jgi:hypothetical protein
MEHHVGQTPDEPLDQEAYEHSNTVWFMENTIAEATWIAALFEDVGVTGYCQRVPKAEDETKVLGLCFHVDMTQCLMLRELISSILPVPSPET